LWGAAGISGASRTGASGGYYMPGAYVQEVARAQTSQLPDPYDPAPIARGIGVYYTALTWGGISFAILEDRKFKTGPQPHMAKIMAGQTQEELKTLDPAAFDMENAVLLGNRQIEFLRDWTDDWEAAKMKAVLSQTIFCASANLSQNWKKEGPPIVGIRFDFDTNGWPQSGRNRALSEIRKSFSIMIAGDQHLGSVIQHGINDWNDAGYSFASPGIANLWTRSWKPDKPGKNKKHGAPDYTGEFLDAFGNKITYYAAANPSESPDHPDVNQRLTTRAAGFGVIRFKKSTRDITFECWPRNVDITHPKSKQYDGWPITISQFDNFNIHDGFTLPTLNISKKDQVVTVTDTQTGEIISSVRILGTAYQPKVYKKGIYTITIGEGEAKKILENITSGKSLTTILKVFITE
ncbi:MAG: hypothetical protein HRU40_11800, partial [Saprospiraceae bacterium]|nr:hypothetical protein [Saprospiraceae bacterium]